ncbi:MAG: hypothetical protein WA802_14155 [Terracidiphilus sp.]
MQRLELGGVGAFARVCHDAGIAQFCLLSPAESAARSQFRYVQMMGKKKTAAYFALIRVTEFVFGFTIWSRFPGLSPISIQNSNAFEGAIDPS